MRNRAVMFLVGVMAAACAQAEPMTDNDSGYIWTIDVGSDGGAKITAVTPTPVGKLVIPFRLAGYSTVRIGPRVFKDCTGLEEVEMPLSMRIIDDEAFMGCTALKKVTYVDSLTAIGDSAFRDCSALESFLMLDAYRTTDDGLTVGANAFSWCEGLRRIALPSCLTSVGSDAFSRCRELKDVTTPMDKRLDDLFPEQYNTITNVVVPSGSRKIAVDAFNSCSSLERVVVSSSVEEIGLFAFAACTVLKKVEFEGGSIAAKTIPAGCFHLCDSLEEIDIPYGIETIDFEAFGSQVAISCKNLKRVKIPQTCRSIGGYAFSVPSLESISIPDDVTNIAQYAFAYCGARSISVGKGWTGVDTAPYAFWGCTNLTEWTVDPGNPAMKALNGLLVTKDGKTLLAGANGDVAIPDSVTKIAPYAFYRYRNLTGVSMPGGVVEIGTQAFNGCDCLADGSGCVVVADTLFYYAGDAEELVIPEGVRKIDQLAFPQSSALKKVVIPDCVEEIRSRAFLNCSGLTEVTIGSGVKAVGERAFSSCDGLKVNTGDIGDWMRIEFLDDNEFWNPHFGSGWRLYRNGREVTELEVPDDLRSVGQFAFWGCASLVDATIPDNVKTIGRGAFYGCTNLGHVAISNGTHAIEERAFARCSSLKNLEIGAGIDSIAHTRAYSAPKYYNKYSPFEGCGNIESIAVGQYVCMEEAFRIFPAAYTNISSVTVCEGVTNIVDGAFRGWPNLTYLRLPNSLTRIGEYAFADCTKLRGAGSGSGLAVPDGVQTICRCAFYGCESLVFVTIGHGIDELGDSIFENCSSLSGVRMKSYAPPSKLPLYDTIFPDNGFCRLLVPKYQGDFGVNYYIYVSGEWNSNVSMEEYSYPCDKLKFDCDGGTVDEVWRDVYLGMKIGALPVPVKDGYVFEGWSTREGGEVNVSKDMTVEDLCLAGAYSECYTVTLHAVWRPGVQFDIDDNDVLLGVRLNGATDVVVPSRVVEIGDGVFENCWGLLSVTLPKGVVRIGNRAFANSFNIASVTMPERLREIGAEAFAGCSSLTNDVVPDCVESIGFAAFSGCSSITRVMIPGSVKELSALAFEGCTSLERLTVMDGCARICIGAFEGCTSLAEISIPDGTVIDNAVFRGCDALSDGKGFIIVRDVLYGWTGDSRDVVIPDGVAEISSGAFEGCETVQRVTIHGNVAKLGPAAFGNCTNLAAAVFLGNAPEMEGDVFRGISSDCCALVGQHSTGWHIADGFWIWWDESWRSNWVRIDYAGEATVTFDANGGKQGTEQFVEKGSFLESLPPCEREGRVFDGWWTEQEGGTRITAPFVVMNSAVYYAHWSLERFTVRFNYEYGYSQEMNYGDTIGYLPYVEDRDGYSFDGWWTQEEGGEQVYESIVVKGDMELFPHWTPNTYYVRFNSNGGNGWMSDQVFAYGGEQALSPVSFAVEDHRFAGWAREWYGEICYGDAAVVSNLTAEAYGVVTLYAVWEKWTASMQLCDDAFGGAGTVSLVEDGNIVVTLTNDVSGTVEIPDNVGAVTIDLNGHDIVGDGGALGESALPSGPAIRVVRGDGEGNTTRLTIVDTSDGEKGQIAGSGESAGVEFADDANSNVRLDVEDGVGVFNGDGSEQNLHALSPVEHTLTAGGVFLRKAV